MADGKTKFLVFVLDGHDWIHPGVPAEFKFSGIHDSFPILCSSQPLFYVNFPLLKQLKISFKPLDTFYYAH